MACKTCRECFEYFQQSRNEQYCSLKCAVISRLLVLGPDQCWEWKGPTGSHGYGAFSFLGVQYTSHRASFIAHYGSIDVHEGHHGGVVMHSCDNRRCANPNHLSVGSQAQNLADAKMKGRASNVGPKGERARTAVLTSQIVLQIRARLSLGESGASLGFEFGVSCSAISSIKTRKSWNHI